MRKDSTFNETSAFGSTSWAAQRLGISKDQFIRKREKLESEGFPTRDELTNLYLKADVDAWISLRRRIPDMAQNQLIEKSSRTEVNLNAI